MYSYPSRILSLDMGNHTYKYIEAQISRKSLNILRFGTGYKSQFSNTNPQVKKWKKLGVRSRNVVLSFHHKSLITRELKLEAKDELDLHRVIQEEFKKYQIELNEDFDFDYNIFSHDPESGIYLTKTAGISKFINREYVEKAIRLGLRPISVDIQINAIIRVLRRSLEHCKYYSDSIPYLVLDLGHKYTTSAIINTKEIISSKCIPIGCNMINDSTANKDEYLKEIKHLCTQMIDHYIFNYEREELKYGIVYGGGAHMTSILSQLKNEISLEWNYLSFFHPYLPNVPIDMDLNLYGNCLGSVYWEEDKRREMRE